MAEMNIYHFYHIWADGDWKASVTNHINEYLAKSNLAYVLSSFEVGIVGSQKNIDEVKVYLKSFCPIDFNICHETSVGYEQETLDKIRLYDKEDGYVLYAHSKGSYNGAKYNIKWKNRMSEKLILDWMNCVDLLKYHALVGTQYCVSKNKDLDVDKASLLPPSMTNTDSLDEVRCYPNSITEGEKGIFFGNFWWSHLRYLNRLSSPKREHRYQSERWIFDLQSVVDDKPFTVFDKDPCFDLEYFQTGFSKGKNPFYA